MAEEDRKIVELDVRVLADITGGETLPLTDNGMGNYQISLDIVRQWLNGFYPSDTDFQAHVNNQSIHFGDAPANNEPYVRQNGAWALLSDVGGLGTYNEVENTQVSQSVGRAKLNFRGTGDASVNIIDDAINDRTTVEINASGGGGGGGVTLDPLSVPGEVVQVLSTAGDGTIVTTGITGIQLENHINDLDDDHVQYFNQIRGDARYSLTTHGHSPFDQNNAGFVPAPGAGSGTRVLQENGVWAENASGAVDRIYDSGTLISTGRGGINFIEAGAVSIVIADNVGDDRADVTIDVPDTAFDGRYVRLTADNIIIGDQIFQAPNDIIVESSTSGSGAAFTVRHTDYVNGNGADLVASGPNYGRVSMREADAAPGSATVGLWFGWTVQEEAMYLEKFDINTGQEVVDGTSQPIRISKDGGVLFGDPAGGFPPWGQINAEDVLVNGVSLTGGSSIGTYNEVLESGVSQSSARGGLNFIEGANVTIDIVDQAGLDRTDITITAAAGGGGNGVQKGTPFTVGKLAAISSDALDGEIISFENLVPNDIVQNTGVSVNANFPRFVGTGGKTIEDSGLNVNSFTPAAHVGSGGASVHPEFTISAAGFVPPPGAGSGTRILREDGTWIEDIGSAGTINEVQEEGVSKSTNRPIIDFRATNGATVTVTDDVPGTRAVVTIDAPIATPSGIEKGVAFEVGEILSVQDDAGDGIARTTGIAASNVTQSVASSVTPLDIVGFDGTTGKRVQNTGVNINNVPKLDASNTFQEAQYIDVDASVGGSNAVVAVTDTSFTEDAALSAWGATASLSLRGSTQWHQWRQFSDRLALQEYNTGTGNVEDADVIEVFDDAGVVLSSADGASQGEGTLNAKGLFINGVPITSGGGDVFKGTTFVNGDILSVLNSTAGTIETIGFAANDVQRLSQSQTVTGDKNHTGALQVGGVNVVTTAQLPTTATFYTTHSYVLDSLPDGAQTLVPHYVDVVGPNQVTTLEACTFRLASGTAPFEVRLKGVPQIFGAGTTLTPGAAVVRDTVTNPPNLAQLDDIDINLTATGVSGLTITLTYQHVVTLA